MKLVFLLEKIKNKANPGNGFVCISIIFLLAFASCSQPKYPGFSKTELGIFYKIFNFGESSNKPVATDYITIDIEYRTIKKDSLFFSGRRKFQTTKPDYKGSIDECFSMLSTDDSASFIINANKFFKATLKAPLPSFFDKQSDMKINVKMLNIQSRLKFIKEKEEFLSWTNDLSDYEKTLLKHFIQEKDISIQPTRSGLYCIKTFETQGARPKGGNIVTVHYEGQFLNGDYFDSTKKRNMPFDFVFGKEMQVVKGLEEGIGLMREGEKAILIMPSQLAFGQMGSSTGIIPPFTTIVFKVEILKIQGK
jgi:FKBP-type peptidyl-prolyl cis-trans isomerase